MTNTNEQLPTEKEKTIFIKSEIPKGTKALEHFKIIRTWFDGFTLALSCVLGCVHFVRELTTFVL